MAWGALRSAGAVHQKPDLKVAIFLSGEGRGRKEDRASKRGPVTFLVSTFREKPIPPQGHRSTALEASQQETPE